MCGWTIKKHREDIQQHTHMLETHVSWKSLLYLICIKFMLILCQIEVLNLAHMILIKMYLSKNCY